MLSSTPGSWIPECIQVGWNISIGYTLCLSGLLWWAFCNILEASARISEIGLWDLGVLESPGGGKSDSAEEDS